MNFVSRQQDGGLECDHERREHDIDCRECAIRNRMLFADIDVEAAELLLGPVKHLWFSPGEVLYRQGESPAAIYSVRCGVIKLSLTSEAGDLRIVRLIGPGAAIGLEVLSGEAYLHQAEALTDIDLCRIPRATISRLREQQPVLCKRLMKQWQDQVAQADEHLLQLSTGTIKRRVHTLLQIVDRLCTQGDIHFQLPSNPDIAALVAARVESVSRIMAEAKREGLLLKEPDGRWTLARGNPGYPD